MATFTLNSKITIGAYRPFAAISDVVIRKSLKNYNDTAVLVLPASAVLKQNATGQRQKVDTARQFQRGDKIKIELGYNENLKPEFDGFIARVSKSVPCQLECEGYAFQLRDKSINKVYRGVSLKAILTDLIEGTDIVLHPDSPDIKVDRIDFIKFPRLKALQMLIKDCGDAVSIWFEGNVLFCGMKYLFFSEKNQNWKADVIFRAGHNYIRDGQLKERIAGDAAYEVEFSTKDDKGKQKKVSVGVVNSNVQRKRLLAFKDLNTLKKLATEKENALNYTGVEGGITGFLIPFVKPGMKLKLVDDRWPELGGNYLVEEVETRFSTSGARRKIKISVKL